MEPSTGHFIDMDGWARRKTFAFFAPYEQPLFSLTAHLDVTALYAFAKREGLSYFLVQWYAVLRAVNEVPELRQRMRGDRVWEFDQVSLVSTFLLDDERFDFCQLPMAPTLDAFITAGTASIEALRAGQPMDYDPEASRDDLIYGTVIPWIDFIGVTHPHRIPAKSSVPVIALGRRVEVDGRARIACAVEAHHSVVDGLHVGRLFKAMQRYCDEPSLLNVPT